MYRGKYPQNVRSVSYTRQIGLYLQTNNGEWFRVQTKDIPAGSAMPKVGGELPDWVARHPQK